MQFGACKETEGAWRAPGERALLDCSERREIGFSNLEYADLEKSFLDSLVKRISAFTVAELGEMLPVEIEKGEKKNKKHFHIYLAKEHGDFSDETRYFVEYQERKTNYEVEVQRCADTEADARARMLVYLLEQNLISASS